jgi:hypothetical protein
MSAAQTKDARSAPLSGRKFQPCVWPNCAPSSLHKPDAVRKSGLPGKPSAQDPLLYGQDPLKKQIIEGRILDSRHGGVISAIRLPEGRILYQGEPLKDALNNTSMVLPASKLAIRAKPAAPSSDKDWNSVDMKTASADQINAMRAQRKALTGHDAESHSASDRMWGK